MTTMTIPRASAIRWQYETPAIGGIVVGFDGSPASHAAIESAAIIAGARKCAVHVVSVLRPMSSYRIDLKMDQPRSEVEDLRIQLREAAIRDAIGQLYERADWTRQVATGNPAQKIAAMAERMGADLIILGRSQRGVLDRMLSGETTLQVMRLTSVPVLVVAEEMKKPATVVAAVDFGPASLRAAAMGLEMLNGSGTLYLVHVDEPVEVFPDGFVLPDPDYSRPASQTASGKRQRPQCAIGRGGRAGRAERATKPRDRRVLRPRRHGSSCGRNAWTASCRAVFFGKRFHRAGQDRSQSGHHSSRAKTEMNSIERTLPRDSRRYGPFRQLRRCSGQIQQPPPARARRQQAMARRHFQRQELDVQGDVHGS